MPDVKRYATRRAAVLFRTYSFASDRLECWPERDVARRHGTGAVRPATNAVKPRTMDAPRVRPQQAAARLEVRQAYAKTEARLCCRLVDNWSFKFLSSTKTGHVAMLCRGSRPVESRRTRPDAARGGPRGMDTIRASGLRVYPGRPCRLTSMLIVQVRAIDWGRRRQHQPGRRGLRAGLATTRTHRPHVALRAACA